ncbi:hypothetical protein [Paenibacillus polymyxa]|uniref:hypothetical protein n=1 Tax=Paenibacillus polymyxa TaxID=1406 RepID=UPI0025B65CFD|nr:hypothetical protein [Paenibacillus polymyxa]MDN4090896.1 hypothetical protein [Paenibacillus polymyxa]
MKRKGFLVITLLLLLSIVLHISSPFIAGVHAEGGGGSTSSSSSSGSFGGGESGKGDGGSDDEGGSSLVPQFILDLMDKIDSLLQNIQDLMSGKLLHDAIQGLVVMWVDEMLTPLYSGYTSYLFTPRVAEVDVVLKGWTIFSIMGAVAVLIGSLILGWNIARAKKDLSALLKAFIVSFFAIIASLTILNIINVGVNWISQISMEGIIGTTGIQYQGLRGEQILKAVILGSDGITDEMLEDQTLGQLVAATQGGLFNLGLFVANIAAPLWFIGVFKTLLMMLMAIFVAFWITYTAYSGKIETLVGFLNLYIRTTLVGYLSALHWAVFVRLQTDYATGTGFSAALGVPPIYLAILSVYVMIIFFYFFWLKPIWKAVRQPVTLGGGEVVKRAGDYGQRMSTAMNAIGKRLGSDGLQSKSLSLASKAKRVSEVGEMMKQQRFVKSSRAVSALTGGISEVLQGVKYKEMPDRWMETGGTVVGKTSVELPTENSLYTTASAREIYASLKPQGYQGATVVQIDSQYDELLPKALQSIQAKHKDAVSWNGNTRELLVKSNSGAVMDRLKEFDIATDSAVHGYAKDNVFVNAKNKKIVNFGDPKNPQNDEALKSVVDTLGGYRKVQLRPDEAQNVYRNLQQSQKKNPWAAKVVQRNDGLMIPVQAMKQALPMIESMVSKVSTKMQINLPTHSQFLSDMLEDWKNNPETKELARSLEVMGDGYSVLVPKEKVDSFNTHYGAYRKGRTLYWRTRKGQYMTVADGGVPMSIGDPPAHGLNMGSYEKLQEETLSQHESGKVNGQGANVSPGKQPTKGVAGAKTKEEPK